MSTDTNRFGAESTTDEVLAGIDLTGKTAVVTGASGGIGAESARALASRGAQVILLARDLAKTTAKAEEIRTSTGNPEVYALAMDLADLTSVRQASNEICQRWPTIHVLINNAGVMACPEGRTAQGYETQFGTNHLGHFVFTQGLIGALIAGAPSRVVVLSSGGHKYCNIDFADLNWEQRPYDKWMAYGQAKTANSLFAVELDRRYRDQGVRAFAVHPGMIFTDLGRHLTEADYQRLAGDTGTQKVGAKTGDKDAAQGRGQRGKLVLKSIPAGAATSVWAATAAELEGTGGLYLEDCRIGECVTPGTQSHGYYAYAVDPMAAERLWQASATLTRLETTA